MSAEVCTMIDSAINNTSKALIPDELICPLCGDLLSNAIMLPCCAESTCYVCAKDALFVSLKEVVNVCPLENCLSKNISLDDLIPNRNLRQKASALRQQYPDILSNKQSSLNFKINNPDPTPPNLLAFVTNPKEACNTAIVETKSTNFGAPAIVETQETYGQHNIQVTSLDGDSKAIISTNPNTVYEVKSDVPQAMERFSLHETAKSQTYDLVYNTQNAEKDINVMQKHATNSAEARPDEHLITMSASYNLPDFQEEAEKKNSELSTKANLILAEKEVDIEFDDSTSSEPPIPGEESSLDLIKRNIRRDNQKAINNAEISDCEINTTEITRKHREIDCKKNNRRNNHLSLEGHRFNQGSHMVDIPAQYLSEAVEDPLAVFNKLMAVKDKEKGILNSLQHYGPPRQGRSRFSPVHNYTYTSYPPEYFIDTKREYAYTQPLYYDRHEKPYYPHGRCYNCDRSGHCARDCPERFSPSKSYKRDYRKHHQVRRSLEDKIERKEEYQMKKRYEHRSSSPKRCDIRKSGENRRSISPISLSIHPQSSTHTVHINSPQRNVKKDKSFSPPPAKTLKKSKHKDKTVCLSMPTQKQTKQRKDETEVEEISTYVELNAHVYERCTKKKKDKKKKIIYSDLQRLSSDETASDKVIDEIKKQKIKKKKKKSDKALEILDKEILQLLTKDYKRIDKNHQASDVKPIRSPIRRKEKNSRKELKGKCSSKSSRKQVKKNCSTKEKYKLSPRKEHKKREEISHRKKSKKY